MITWKTTEEDGRAIYLIAQRLRGLQAGTNKADINQLVMSLTACHLNSCELDLKSLLVSSDVDLIHDIYGIYEYLDTTTCELNSEFIPRYAKRPRADAVVAESALRGFTLIEMLVSVSIVGVVISITLPAISHARAQAQRAECSSNMRSIGMATMMHVDANGGRLPMARYDAHAGTDDVRPWDQVSRYLDARLPGYSHQTGEAERLDPWVCPSDPFVGVETGYSYQYTPAAFFATMDDQEHRRISSMFLDQPSATLVLDFLPVHSGIGHERRNALRIDGSVRGFSGVVCSVR